MKNWYECRVKSTRIDELTGKEKVMSEPYLVDAVSFTGAEAVIIKEMQPYISGNFHITGIKPTRFSEVIKIEGSKSFYKAKVAIITIDDRSGKESKVIFNLNNYL
jgi:hypothetical protein